MGYKFQFATLTGFNPFNITIFELAKTYSTRGLDACSGAQINEFDHTETKGFKAVKIQSFVGTSYLEAV